ncbi:hypothetical protein NL30_14690 [Burkholderia contaminans]|uniref:hypothetical protein n=1 Tax=Burkholderia contaminans TaxID=488447 RepID=UPI0006496D61|nr:hypothetical protein [Burkholderia contaminans]AKM41042.1 hypothetical protein NL30_14690 [Burkholderia contaminans]
MVVLDLGPVVGIAAPIYFIGAAIMIGAARYKHPSTQAPARASYRTRASPRVISLRQRTASNP